jgi:ABC-type lipoprotein export system ATPase subunit
VGKLLLDLHREENNILIVVTHSQELASTFPAQMVMDDGTLKRP